MKHKIFKIFIKFIGTFLITFFLTILAFVILVYFAFFRNACTKEYLNNSISPDKKNMAVVYTYECGATTDFSTIVKIIKNTNDETKGWRWNDIFVVKSYNKTVNPLWLNDNNLEIFYEGPPRWIYKQKNKYKNIDIIYNITETPEP